MDDFLNGKRVNYFQPFQTLFVLAALYLMTVQLVDPNALVRPTDEGWTTEEWAKGNKAFSILLTVPLFALSSWCVFRRKSIRRRYNLTEHVFIQTFIACQILLLSILAVPVNGEAAVDDLYDVPAICIYLLFCYDHCQLYRISGWKSCRYTLWMFLLSLPILIIGASVIVGIVYLLL